MWLLFMCCWSNLHQAEIPKGTNRRNTLWILHLKTDTCVCTCFSSLSTSLLIYHPGLKPAKNDMDRSPVFLAGRRTFLSSDMLYLVSISKRNNLTVTQLLFPHNGCFLQNVCHQHKFHFQGRTQWIFQKKQNSTPKHTHLNKFQKLQAQNSRLKPHTLYDFYYLTVNRSWPK